MVMAVKHSNIPERMDACSILRATTIMECAPDVDPEVVQGHVDVIHRRENVRQSSGQVTAETERKLYPRPAGSLFVGTPGAAQDISF